MTTEIVEAHLNEKRKRIAFGQIGISPLLFLEFLKPDLAHVELNLYLLKKSLADYKRNPGENCIVSLYNDLALLDGLVTDIKRKIRKAEKRGCIIVSGRLIKIDKKLDRLRTEIAGLPNPYDRNLCR